jgi:uroporphyrinogen decarboxylase
MMNSRERFRETMSYGAPDRVPYFEEGIRNDVLKAWRRQGLPPEVNPAELFPSDRREELLVDVDPRPTPKKWPTSRTELAAFSRRLDPDDHDRLPAGWAERVRAWSGRDYVVMLRLHRGFFQTMGVQDWSRFREIIYLLSDDPAFVREAMAIQGDFAVRLAEKILAEVEVDAVIFSEPIGGNDRPLLSPKMYEEFVLASYEPVLDVLRRYRVETIILRTYANARLLIPSILKWGFNCLWACEVNLETMDYRDLRREFGRDLRLIGGIDLDALRQDKAAIRREVEEKVPPLLAGGGYVPLADGRVRPDVPLENYVYYRQLLAEVTAR